MIEASIEDFNLIEIISFLKEKYFAKRLETFYQRYVLEAGEIVKDSVTNDVIKIEYDNEFTVEKIITFLEGLCLPSEAGNIMISSSNLSFVLIDPSPILKDLFTEAHSVIFVGGTLKPYQDIETLVHSSLRENITTFSCDHVVPKQHVLTKFNCKGPTNKLLRLTFKTLKNEAILKEFGLTLINLSRLIPKGMIVFFPSYQILDKIYKFWYRSSNIIKRIEMNKPIFYDSRDVDVTDILSNYSKACLGNPKSSERVRGGVLMTVVNGRLSEGINFADDLCRGVIMIGMPFPNVHDNHELKLRISKSFMKDYALIQCMKSVNQSIGRAIRNKNDYASIIFLDERYQKEEVKKYLPSWVLRNFTISKNFGQTYKSLRTFYQQRESERESG